MEDTVSLEVESREQAGVETYFRLSNGQLLRRDAHGSIIEYNNRFESIEAQEVVIFDFTNLGDAIQLPYNVFPPTLGRGVPSPYPTTRYITEGHRDVPDFAKDCSIAAFGSTFGVASGYGVHLAQGIGVVLCNHGGDMGEYEYFELIEYLIGDSRLDFNGNGKTNLDNLFFFADQFGTQQGDDNWDAMIWTPVGKSIFQISSLSRTSMRITPGHRLLMKSDISNSGSPIEH